MLPIARLEFDLAGQPEHKQSLGRIVPIHFSHARTPEMLPKFFFAEIA